MMSERTIAQMLHAMSPCGDCLSVDISSTDYTVPAFKTDGSPLIVKGIITADGTVIKVDKKNSAAMSNDTVVVYLPSPAWSGLDGITKVYKTGTDATKITLIIE
jgi:hypothetical protein